MQDTPTITTDSLRELLSSGDSVNTIDIRPGYERSERFIPGSIHVDPPSPLNFISIVEKNFIGNYAGINSVALEAGSNPCVVS